MAVAVPRRASAVAVQRELAAALRQRRERRLDQASTPLRNLRREPQTRHAEPRNEQPTVPAPA